MQYCYHCLACAVPFADMLVLALSQEVDCCFLNLSLLSLLLCHHSLAEAVMMMIVLSTVVVCYSVDSHVISPQLALVIITTNCTLMHTTANVSATVYDAVSISPVVLCDSCFSFCSCGCPCSNAAAWHCSCFVMLLQLQLLLLPTAPISSPPLVDCRIFIVFPLLLECCLCIFIAIFSLPSLFAIYCCCCHCHCCCCCHGHHCHHCVDDFAAAVPNYAFYCWPAEGSWAIYTRTLHVG